MSFPLLSLSLRGHLYVVCLPFCPYSNPKTSNSPTSSTMKTAVLLLALLALATACAASPLTHSRGLRTKDADDVSFMHQASAIAAQPLKDRPSKSDSSLPAFVPRRALHAHAHV